MRRSFIRRKTKTPAPSRAAKWAGVQHLFLVQTVISLRRYLCSENHTTACSPLSNASRRESYSISELQRVFLHDIGAGRMM
jgi:hypothetical protein